jgi:hypothetical protein
VTQMYWAQFFRVREVARSWWTIVSQMTTLRVDVDQVVDACEQACETQPYDQASR